MASSWRRSVCQNTFAARLQDILRYAKPHPEVRPSPLDSFYTASRDIIRAATPNFLSEHPTVGPLLLVGLVSASENYFRDLLASILRLCPIARSESAEEQIRLGSVLWHGSLEVERGAFEGISFAAAKNVKTTIQKFTRYQIKAKGEVDSILEDFEKVCEIRHAVVHSGNIVAGKNALRLALAANSRVLRINVEYGEIQECAAVCTNLVLATNGELFDEFCRRWAIEWRSMPSWDPSKEDQMFAAIWNIFHSEIDSSERRIGEPKTCLQVQGEVLLHYSPV